MRSHVAKTLQQLVQLPSVNPMGVPEWNDTHGESRVSDYLQHWFDQRGISWLRQSVHPGRDNVIAVLSGDPPVDQSGRYVLWEVHQDTVGIDGMTIDPFGGNVDAKRVWGRGACDVKGSMAAMLVALDRLAALPESERTTVVLACAASEEYGNTGAHALARLWQPELSDNATVVGGTIRPAELFPRPPDAAIVAEPTSLNVVVAHKGLVRWRVHLHGRAAHTSDPSRGVNAIYGAARVALAIQQYGADVLPELPVHPLCGPPTVSASTLRGGVGVNTVPDLATLEIDRRITPDETPASAREQLVQYVGEQVDLGECTVTHDPPFSEMAGLTDSANASWAEQVADVAQQTGQAGELVGANYGTDAPAIAATGVPTVVIGPGSIEQAHTADEWIAIEQLERAVELYFEIGRRS